MGDGGDALPLYPSCGLNGNLVCFYVGCSLAFFRIQSTRVRDS